MRLAEKVTRNVGILRRALAGEGSRSLVESVVQEAALLECPEFVGERSTDLEPIPETREERLRKVMQISVQPRAKDIMGNLREVYDKIYNVPNEICWRCRLNIDSHCTAFLLVSSEEDQEYRRGATALCIYVLQGRIAK